MVAFASQRPGAWSDDSTSSPWWVSGGTPCAIPGDGDTVTISHDVTVDVNVTVGSDNAGGVAAIAWGNTSAVKALTVASGKTLRCKGDVSNPYGTFGRLAVAAGGTFAFYPASGATLKYDVQYVGQFVCNGSSGSRATVTTDKGRGGNNSYINSYIRPGLITATYTDFSHFGDATHYGLQTHAYSVDGDIAITDCTFNDCSYSCPCDSSWNENFAFSRNKFTNSVKYTVDSPASAVHFSFPTAASGGKTRVSDGCSFDTLTRWTYQNDHKVTNCVFLAGHYSTSGSHPDGTFWTGNLIAFSSATDAITDLAVVDHIDGSYYVDKDTANPHFCTLPGKAVSVTNCLFEATGSAADGDVLLMSTSTALTATGNIVLPNAASGSSGKLTSGGNATSASATGYHNTICVYDVEDAAFSIGENTSTYSGMLTAVRSNLAWASAAAHNCKLIHDWDSTPGVDALTLASHNGFWNPTSGTIKCAGTNQTAAGYSGISVTASGFPNSQVGTSDVSGNPGFVDSTRKLATWSSYKGGAGTVADALARVAADPTLVASDLIPWVRAGFAPTNAAFHNTGHDGTDIGAVAYLTTSATVSPTAIASAEAFGTAVLSVGAVTVSPTAIASAEAFGTAVLSAGAVALSPTAIASAEAFGTALLTTGAVAIAPTAIASAEAFGTAALTGGGVTVSPTAIASAEAFGTAVLTGGGVTVSATAIASAEAFGTAALTVGAVALSPTAIASAEAFGTAVLTGGVVTLTPTGIASAEAFGAAVLTGGLLVIDPSGIASGEAFGLPVVTGGVTLREAVVAALKSDATLSAIVGGRVYPGVVPANRTRPALSCWLLSDVPGRNLSGPNGTSTARVKLVAHSKVLSEDVALAEALRLAIDGLTGTTLGGIPVLACWLDPEADDFSDPGDGTGRADVITTTTFFIRYRKPKPVRA